MSPRGQQIRQAEPSIAYGRRRIAERYLELAELSAVDEGPAVNVAIGNAVLAGIAAADAICIMQLGHFSAGPDHAAAARMLGSVVPELERRLGELVVLKNLSHYGDRVMTRRDRDRALRAARLLVDEAMVRTA